MNHRALVAVLVIGFFVGCEPTKEENYYINSLEFWRIAKAAKVPEPTTVLLQIVACKKARQDRERLRVARKFAAECDVSPEDFYYQKTLAAFPEALAGASELTIDLRRACEAANASLQPSPPSGTPRDRDRLPSARQLAEECDRSLDKLVKASQP